MAKKRLAFRMKVYPEKIAEYKKRHDQLWPELHQLLKESGISEYSIFYDKETNYLFAFQKQSGKQSSQDLGQTEIVKRWWDHMAEIMETNPDNSPVSIPLEEVFFMK
jgi:L-rhamnose mutarotase